MELRSKLCALLFLTVAMLSSALQSTPEFPRRKAKHRNAAGRREKELEHRLVRKHVARTRRKLLHHPKAKLYSTSDSAKVSDEEKAALKGCETQHSDEDNWCEEFCINPNGELAVAMDTSDGSCAEVDFNTFDRDVDVGMFQKDDGSLPQAGVFNEPPGCNAWRWERGTICQSFCIPPDDHSTASKRTGMKQGSCLDNGYTKYVGDGTVKIHIP